VSTYHGGTILPQLTGRIGGISKEWEGFSHNSPEILIVRRSCKLTTNERRQQFRQKNDFRHARRMSTLDESSRGDECGHDFQME